MTTLIKSNARRTFASAPIFTKLKHEGETYTYQIDSFNRHDNVVEVRNIHTQVTTRVPANAIDSSNITTDVKSVYSEPDMTFIEGGQVFIAML